MTSDGLAPRTLDLTPRPGAAPFARQVAAQASMEARLMLRNGEQLLLAVVIPVIVLIGCVLGAHRVGRAGRPRHERTGDGARRQ